MSEEPKGRGRPHKSQVYEPDLPITEEATAPNGLLPISTAPKDRRIVVMDETMQKQALVYWRERRVVDRKNLRYLHAGNWTQVLNRLDIDFSPMYWREYQGVDFIPVQEVK